MHSWFDVAQVESLIRQYGYPVLTILTVLGNMGIPVPEESVTILAGYAAHEGWLGYGNVLAFCIIAAICGDNLGYLIGRTGGRPMLRRYGHYVGLHHARLEVIERYVNDHGAKTVLLARFSRACASSPDPPPARCACLSGVFSFSTESARRSGSRR